VAYSHATLITCSQCGAWYNSESDLSDHMHAAHRRCVPEPNTLPNLREIHRSDSKSELGDAVFKKSNANSLLP
jgi:hypothetical protein